MFESSPSDLSRRLDRLEAGQKQILALLKGEIMPILDTVVTDVAAEDTVIDSAITLLNGLSAALQAAGTDPAKLAALDADINARKQALAAAVVANTPAATGATGDTGATGATGATAQAGS